MSSHSRASLPPVVSGGIDELRDNEELEGDRDRTGKSKAPESLRRSQACLACRKRKLRCDAKKPTCSRCEAAWRAFDSRSDPGEPDTTAPPPCEYDVSLFSKIFKRPASPESSSMASGPGVEKSASSRPAGAARHSLQVDNERLRARITLLEADLHANDSVRESGVASSSASSHEGGRLNRHSLGMLRDQEIGSSLPQKRKMSAGPTFGPYPDSRRWNKLHSSDQKFDSSEDRTLSKSTSSQLFASSSSSAKEGTRPSTPPSALLAASSSRFPLDKKLNPPSTPTDAFTRITDYQTATPPPPLPPSDLMLEMVDAFTKSSWLAFAFNAFALSDLVVMLDSSTPSRLERYITEAVLMALIAVSLPFCPSVVAQLADLLGQERISTASIFNSMGPIPMITNAYASGARELLRQIRMYGGQQSVHDTLPAQLLLVEYAANNNLTRESHNELAQAVVEARFLDLHDLTSGVSPKLEYQSTRNTELSHALNGLMQAKQQNYAFWYLYVQDCFQSRLAGSPSLIDRDSIRTIFPGRLDSQTSQTIQQARVEVSAYLRKDAGLPQLEAVDNVFCVLIKATMVLEDCCEFAVRVRSTATSGSATTLSDLRQGRDSSFQAINEEIRLLRLVLNQFNDTGRKSTRAMEGGATRLYREPHEMQDELLTENLIRFSADTMHHLCVLALFGGLIDTEEPFEQGDSRDVVKTAATWISRLAETTLRPSSLLSVSLAPGCSMAFFIAARWSIYLQIAFPTEFQLELSTLTAALWTRANNCANDYLLAKAIVALARQRDTFGRICISPFTWPIDAVSVFVPISRPFGPRSRPERGGDSAMSISIQALASSVEDAAVEKLVMFSAR